MTKTVNLDQFKASEVGTVDNAKSDRPTLANRVMPKRDHMKVIEHDRVYLTSLKDLFAYLAIEIDVLGEESGKILAKQDNQEIRKNIATIRRWEEAKVEALDLQAKIQIQEKLINDKQMHFENVFMPQWEKEVAETRENFTETFSRATTLNLSPIKPEGSEKILKAIDDELYWFNALTEEEKKDEEYMWQVYKPLKRLLGAYDDLTEEKTGVSEK